MSRRSDKCTETELATFKDTVINWLKGQGINTDGLDVRAFNCYGGDVRIYLGEYMEIPNSRRSFRREYSVKEDDGARVYGTRGHHITRKAQPVIINRLEWSEFQAAANPAIYNSYTDDFARLVAHKKLVEIGR